MADRTGRARWEGNFARGTGTMSTGTGAVEGVAYSAASRFEEGEGTNPEEMIGAAHAGCFSMALSLALTEAGSPPDWVETTATVSIEKVGEGFEITRILLDTEASVPDISEEDFLEQAEAAKRGCPVSKVLAGAEISLEAKLTT
jgi:osmotically inducible protein OsmC